MVDGKCTKAPIGGYIAEVTSIVIERDRETAYKNTQKLRKRERIQEITMRGERERERQTERQKKIMFRHHSINTLLDNVIFTIINIIKIIHYNYSTLFLTLIIRTNITKQNNQHFEKSD